jgi:tetratricopeptide (TPR) repeat protein
MPIATRRGQLANRPYRVRRPDHFPSRIHSAYARRPETVNRISKGKATVALTAERIEPYTPVPLPAPAPPPGRVAAILFALLGYAYLAALLALVLLVGAAGLLVVRWQLSIWLLVPALGVAGLLLQLLRVSLTAPDGIILSRNDAGPLFAAVDELRLALRAPAIYTILLTDDLAVRAVQQPGLGLFGRYRTTLLVGLPLLQTLTWDQTRAILARELALLAGTPGWTDGWLRRRRLLWGRLLEQLEADTRWWRVVVRPFFRWYVPRFLAYSAPLIGVQDHAADHAAAGAISPRHAADALLALAIARRFLDHDFWPGIYRQLPAHPDPPAPYSTLPAALDEALHSTIAATWLAAALNDPADPAGHAPSLAERLAALGQEPRLPPRAAPAAGQVFVTRLHLAVADIDRRWRDAIAPAWRERHADARETIDALRAIDAAALARPLTAGEALQRARWTEEFGNTDEALARYREALAADPDRAELSYATGRLQLARGDDRGLALLDRAMALDPEQVLPACALAIPFLAARGRTADADRYRLRARRRVQLLQAARAERADVDRTDRLTPHTLTAEQLAWLTANLATFPDLRAAYLARKEALYLPERPIHLLAILADRTPPDALAPIFAPIKTEGDTFLILPLDARRAWLKHALEQVPDAAIYRR